MFFRQFAWWFPFLLLASYLLTILDLFSYRGGTEGVPLMDTLMGEWSTNKSLIRKFVTWISHECHRLSQKRNDLGFQTSFEMKLGGIRWRALQHASTAMR